MCIIGNLIPRKRYFTFIFTQMYFFCIFIYAILRRSNFYYFNKIINMYSSHGFACVKGSFAAKLLDLYDIRSQSRFYEFFYLGFMGVFADFVGRTKLPSWVMANKL
uniref:Uncharacterized protein n=1 Tax=Pararge aegeria TaxID=116150 RepID=S4PDF0_9NEOP